VIADNAIIAPIIHPRCLPSLPYPGLLFSAVALLLSLTLLFGQFTAELGLGITVYTEYL
jgi:hypothetical protein